MTRQVVGRAVLLTVAAINFALGLYESAVVVLLAGILFAIPLHEEEE